MKKTSKSLSVFLALIMVVSIIPMSSIKAEAASSYTLPVNMNLIRQVGKQTPYTVACGCFCLAYCRTLLDNKVHYWYEYNYYGTTDQNNASAYWAKANYNSTTYSSAQAVFKSAYDQINSGRPCILHVKGRGSTYHYVVCVGYTNVTNVNNLSASNFLILDVVSSFPYEIENMASVGYSLYDYQFVYTNSGSMISTVATTGITLNASPFSLNIGESKTLSATVSPSNATNKTVTWSSSNTSVATVSSSGVVKAVGTGACAITAKASGGQTASVVIIVRNESPAPVANATYNGHYYELYQDVLSWTDAKEYCESKGGHLVTITTQEENSFVQSFASNGEKEKYYIGGTDEVTEGTWKWVTSETFSYINLGTGEPSPTEYEKEDYLYISKITGKWGDIVDITGGVNSYSFICEYDDLSDIVVDQLPEGADPDDYELVTEYRSRDKSTTTSTSSTLDGWTLYDSESTYGSWGSTQTTTSKPTASDTLQIIGTSTQYNYFHYVNYYDGIYNIDSIPYGTSHGKHTITRSSALSKVSLADQGGKQAYGSQTCSCGFNYWFLEGTSTVYSYQTRTKTTTNHFYKWSDWTAWTETPITSTDTKQVETRIGYRLKDENGTDNPDTPEVPDTPNIPDTEFVFSIKQPSRTTIRNKDGIVLHSNIEGTTPTGSYVDWSWNNSKFDVEKNNDGTLTIISENNGKTTFTATLYSADGEVLATDTIEMQSKAGFFDKIGGFLRSLFGATKIYEY